MLQFPEKTQIEALSWFIFCPSWGYTCSSFIHSLLSVSSIPLPNDSRRDCESRHLWFNGLVATSPF